MKNYTVYMLKSNDARVYIGMTQQELHLRCRKDGYRGCPLMQSAIDKLGWGTFEKIALVEDLTKSEAELLEKEFIAQYDSANPVRGFNVALGGNIKGRRSPITLHRMSDSQKGRSFSSEHLEKLRKPKKNGSLKRQVLQYDIDGTFIHRYFSVFEAASAVGGFAESIMRCCNRKQHTAKGYKWQYEEAFK